MWPGFKTFVGMIITTAALLVSWSLFANPWDKRPLLSILQGATTEDSAQFSVLVPKGSDFEVVVDGKVPNWRSQVEEDTSDWAVLKFRFDGLSLGKEYQLQIWDESGMLQDEREFQTLDTQNPRAKLALASCMVDWLHNPGNWSEMESLRPDVVIFLGDTTYVDVGSPGDLIDRKDVSELDHWKRFVETRLTLDIYKWRKLIPVLAMMDDHDYGYDNVDSSFPLKDRANFIFETFFAQRGGQKRFEQGPGQSFKVDLFGQTFLFLDGRTFRTKDRILGDEQLKWMQSLQLKDRTLILSGSQFFGAYLHKDSFEGHFENAFNDFMKYLQTFQTQFVFASGDIHFSELMKIEKEKLGYPTFEITSSSVHSFTVPGGHVFRPFNPRRIPGMVTSTHNFVTLDLDDHNKDLWVVRSHGWRGQDLFEAELRFDPFVPSCTGLIAPQNSKSVPRF